MAGQFIIARNKTWRNTMKTTAFNSPKTRKTKIGEGVYIPPLNSPLLVELMRSSLVRRRVKLCEVKGERERKKKRKSLPDGEVSFSPPPFVAVFSTTRIFEPQRSHRSPPYF